MLRDSASTRGSTSRISGSSPCASSARSLSLLPHAAQLAEDDQPAASDRQQPDRQGGYLPHQDRQDDLGDLFVLAHLLQPVERLRQQADARHNGSDGDRRDALEPGYRHEPYELHADSPAPRDRPDHLAQDRRSHRRSGDDPAHGPGWQGGGLARLHHLPGGGAGHNRPRRK